MGHSVRSFLLVLYWLQRFFRHMRKNRAPAPARSCRAAIPRIQSISTPPNWIISIRNKSLSTPANVVATQGASKLQAGTLVIYLTPKDATAAPGAPSSSSQVRRMEAVGPVTIVSKDQIGTGDSGIYEKSENKVYLIGNVTLTQGPNVTKGDKLIYDLTTNQAAVTGRVRSMFLPSGGASEAKEPKPAKPGDGPQARSGGEGTLKPPFTPAASRSLMTLAPVALPAQQDPCR